MIPPPPAPDVYGQFRSGEPGTQAAPGAHRSPQEAPGSPPPTSAPPQGGGGLLLALLALGAGYFLGQRRAAAKGD